MRKKSSKWFYNLTISFRGQFSCDDVISKLNQSSIKGVLRCAQDEQKCMLWIDGVKDSESAAKLNSISIRDSLGGIFPQKEFIHVELYRDTDKRPDWLLLSDDELLSLNDF